MTAVKNYDRLVFARAQEKAVRQAVACPNPGCKAKRGHCCIWTIDRPSDAHGTIPWGGPMPVGHGSRYEAAAKLRAITAALCSCGCGLETFG